jgi:hypothetical protein
MRREALPTRRAIPACKPVGQVVEYGRKQVARLR